MTPRDTARMWLADPLGVVLDFETTGWVGYACEVAVISMAGEVLLHTRINPGVPIEAGAMAVHGIRNDDLADAPTWRDRLPALEVTLIGRHAVAYGAPYDAGVIRREQERQRECDGWVPVYRCAMQLYRQHAGLKSTVKLETLVPTADHSALGDARAALEVVRRVAGYP